MRSRPGVTGGSDVARTCWDNFRQTAVPKDFVPGLEGVVAFETEIAEPDKDGGALRYRGVDIEDLVGRVTFGDVWALLVDGKFGARPAPGRTVPPPGPHRRRAGRRPGGLAMLAPIWGYRPLLDIDDATPATSSPAPR